VWGLGTLGLSAIMGCKNAGAKNIIGVDINPDKFKLAAELGATDFVNPTELSVPIEQYLNEKYEGAIEYTFECVGRVPTMMQAFDSCAIGNGVCVLIGVAELTATMPISPGHLLVGKTLKGSLYGGYKSRDAVPKLVDDFMNGKLKIGCFITHTMKLEDINEGFDLLRAGKSIRTILEI
jgi:Zn-dependent alcohol dehydrogenase